jgi:hypothetical protein
MFSLFCLLARNVVNLAQNSAFFKFLRGSFSLSGSEDPNQLAFFSAYKRGVPFRIEKVTSGSY